MIRLAGPVLAAALALAAAGCYESSGAGGSAEPAAPPPAETAPATTEEPPATTAAAAGDARAGKAVFLANCAACHTLAAAGATGTVGPNLDDAKPPLDLVLNRVRVGGGAMPPFEGTLSEEQIQDVAAFVSSSAGT
jgi:mono/diheme cytochrome c family protein